MVEELQVDRTSPVPLYHQVACGLEELITSGEYPPGTRLDNEIALADRLGVSRPTMRKAMEYLVQHGLVVRQRGVGTQVVGSRVYRPVELSSLHDDLVASGQRPRTTVLGLERHAARDAGSDLSEFGMDGAEPVWVLERLRSTAEIPLALMRNIIPAEHLHLHTEDLASQGLYGLMRRHGITIRFATQRIGAKAATADEAQFLQVEQGAPLLTMRRMAFDERGAPVELGEHRYRADRYSFDVTVSTASPPGNGSGHGGGDSPGNVTGPGAGPTVEPER